MAKKNLSTESYKGVRDFFPQDAAIQNYIFKTWSKTAESFGYARYDASIFEPSELYKAKGAENEEMVNEQTYTFTDRGDREVTLRPEMTPTIARMVAAKRRELAFPLRWYSIPNLFRYERPQRGRLREHWQLNCDIFGTSDIVSDVESIALAYQTLIDFGATSDMFQIQINNRQVMQESYLNLGLTEEQILSITRLNDRKNKIPADEYRTRLNEITNDQDTTTEIISLLENPAEKTTLENSLNKLGINNVFTDKSLARGFDYYTGTVFEIFEVDERGNSTGRSLLGGGRYDNLTDMFGGEPVTGIGFGMGDVTMRDFLETHNLIPESVKITAADITIIPNEDGLNLSALNIAQEIRKNGVSVSTDFGTKKTEKKITSARNNGSNFVLVVNNSSTSKDELTIKKLSSNEEKTGTIEELLSFVQSK